MAENGVTDNSGGHRLNPFSRREEHSQQSILLYKITTFASYVLLLVTAFYYNFNAPDKYGLSFWGHNHDSPFAQNSIITSIYWLVLFILQFVYILSFYSSNSVYVTSAANIASHYIASNLLLFGFLHLFVRHHFWLSLLLIVINFFNLSFAYFRHSTTPRFIHIGAVAGPLAWNFVALYWVGALAVGARNLPARIVANIFIWGFLAYGIFFLAAFKDYAIGFALSVLSFSTGVGQLLTHHYVFQLQWIFAFVIGGSLFVLSLAVGFPEILGRDPFPRGQIVSEDRERAPLLADDQV